MRWPRVSLTTLSLVVAVVAWDCSVVRWGLGLPNLLANQLIQPIVMGSAPMGGLLAFGLISVILGGRSQGAWRPFWLGFLACGSVGLILHVLHAYFVCSPGRHYSNDYEMAIHDWLGRCGVPRNSVGARDLHFVLVIVSLVVLLALPQVLLGILGGCVAAWGAGPKLGRRTATR